MEPVYEEDGRCEQFEDDMFKPRYPCYLQHLHYLPPHKNDSLVSNMDGTMPASSPGQNKTIPTSGGFVNPTEHFQPSVEEPSSQVLGFCIPPDYNPSSNDIALTNRKL